MVLKFGGLKSTGVRLSHSKILILHVIYLYCGYACFLKKKKTLKISTTKYIIMMYYMRSWSELIFLCTTNN